MSTNRMFATSITALFVGAFTLDYINDIAAGVIATCILALMAVTIVRAAVEMVEKIKVINAESRLRRLVAAERRVLVEAEVVVLDEYLRLSREGR